MRAALVREQISRRGAREGNSLASNLEPGAQVAAGKGAVAALVKEVLVPEVPVGREGSVRKGISLDSLAVDKGSQISRQAAAAGSSAPDLTSRSSRSRVQARAGSLISSNSGRLRVVERAEVLGVRNLPRKLVDLEDPAAGLPRRQAGSNRLLRLRAARVVELRPHRLPRRCPSRRFWESSLHRF